MCNILVSNSPRQTGVYILLSSDGGDAGGDALVHRIDTYYNIMNVFMVIGFLTHQCALRVMCTIHAPPIHVL